MNHLTPKFNGILFLEQLPEPKKSRLFFPLFSIFSIYNFIYTFSLFLFLNPILLFFYKKKFISQSFFWKVFPKVSLFHIALSLYLCKHFDIIYLLNKKTKFYNSFFLKHFFLSQKQKSVKNNSYQLFLYLLLWDSTPGHTKKTQHNTTTDPHKHIFSLSS